MKNWLHILLILECEQPTPSILLRGILGAGNGILLLIVLFLGLHLSISEKLFRFHEAGMLFSLVGKLFLGGILAFGLGFSEFLLVSRTSSLTLSIAGIFKVRHGSCARRQVLSHPYWALCGGSLLRNYCLLFLFSLHRSLMLCLAVSAVKSLGP